MRSNARVQVFVCVLVLVMLCAETDAFLGPVGNWFGWDKKDKPDAKPSPSHGPPVDHTESSGIEAHDDSSGKSAYNL